MTPKLKKVIAREGLLALGTIALALAVMAVFFPQATEDGFRWLIASVYIIRFIVWFIIWAIKTLKEN